MNVRSVPHLGWAALLIFTAACAGNDRNVGEDDATGTGGTGGSAGEMGGTGGSTGVGGMAGVGGATGVGGTGGAAGVGGTGGTGGVAGVGGTGGTAGSGVGGAAGAAGTGGTGGTGGSGGDGGQPGAADPIIPEPSGECPDFTAGNQTIMGLDTAILAGEPGPTKGPLLFVWHGTGGDSRRGLGGVPDSIEQDIVSQGGIVVAPSNNGQTREGQDVTFILGVWFDQHDLAYADLITACAVQNHNIDPRQIYTTGCSAGGLMSGVMAVMRSSYVAAAAPNSGGIAAPTYMLEDPMRVPAIMTMHGGANDNVFVNFQDTSNQLRDLLVPAGSFFVDCNHTIGHCAAPAELYESAWEFMKAHPFGTKPSPYQSGLPGSFPDYCALQ